MKIKKIIERIMKIINIVVNLAMTYIAFASFCHYGTSGMMYSDDINRIAWMVAMMVIVNFGDFWIVKKIKEF